jgi:hydroxyacylglutathione hydrolase
MINFSASPVTGNLDVRWIHGSKTEDEPLIQVHAYDEHTIILRQSKSVTYEAPFLYLLFGNDRAILFDTGATTDPARFPLRSTIDGLIADWLSKHPNEEYELVVAHTHSHGDHIAGDSQFADRPRTTVVGTDVDAVTAFFGFTEWPAQVVPYHLGGRTLDVTGIPGHHKTSIAVYDPWTGFLLTGDTVLPGRLYGLDMPTFVTSMDWLVSVAEARPVTYVMGCHIEMSTTPGRDYPIGAKHQPHEAPLQLTMAQLATVREATHAAAAKPGVHPSDDFVVFNGTGKLALVKLLLRSYGQRLRS